MEKTDIAKILRARPICAPKDARSPASLSGAMRARQSQRIKEIRQALVDAGFGSLEQQAAALGLARSTTWSILQGNHKSSGLRASVILRILASSKTPPNARQVIVNYIDEKMQGAYGHSERQRARFGFRLQTIIDGAFAAATPSTDAIETNS